MAEMRGAVRWAQRALVQGNKGRMGSQWWGRGVGGVRGLGAADSGFAGKGGKRPGQG